MNRFQPVRISGLIQKGKVTDKQSCRAFTLTEMLAVMAMLILLAAVMLPVHAGSRLGTEAFRCLNNNRQLCNAWRVYSDDNHDLLLYSSDDGTGSANLNNNYAWTWSKLDFSPSARNYDINMDITQRRLWPYTSRDASIYKCPSDGSFVVAGGVMRPRIRSFSMNLFMGGFAPSPSSSGPGNDGGWPNLDPYRIFSKATDLSTPGPAKTFVFIEERPESINWGNFGTEMNGYSNNPAAYLMSEDFPGLFHNFGSSISFGDGHAEIHRWLDPRTCPPIPQNNGSDTSVPNDPDVAWLQDHATRPK